jgi:hypothetical protein
MTYFVSGIDLITKLGDGLAVNGNETHLNVFIRLAP